MCLEIYMSFCYRTVLFVETGDVILTGHAAPGVSLKRHLYSPLSSFPEIHLLCVSDVSLYQVSIYSPVSEPDSENSSP